MGMTVSMSSGRIAVLHDVREDISANVDVELIGNDVILVDKLKEYNHDISAYTDAKFQPYIDEYNVGKKNCRQIHETYSEHVAKENEKLQKTIDENRKKGIKTFERKPRKLAYEYVLQIGNREDNSTLKMDGETQDQYLQRMKDNEQFCKNTLVQILQKYPHCDVLLASYHADEPNGTPHMHLLVQFDGEGYKKGLSHQVSVSKALELDGFERRESRQEGNYAMQRWIEKVKDEIMTPELERCFSQEREVIGDKRKHIDTPFFRQKAIEEAEALRAEREETKQVHAELDGQIREKQKELDDISGDYGIKKMQLDKADEQLNQKNTAITELDQKIEQQNTRIKEQITEFYDNIDKLSEQEKSITDKKQELDGLTKELSQKSKAVKELDKVTDKMHSQELNIHTVQVPNGIFSKKEVTVIDDYSPKELEKVFQRANINQYAKDTLKRANMDAQAIKNQADQQAQQKLADAQARIDEADRILSQQNERERQLNELEKTVKEKNKALLDENRKMQFEYNAYKSGWVDKTGTRQPSLDELRMDYAQTKQELSGLQDQESELAERLQSKLALVDDQLSPEDFKAMVNDSMITNLVQDTMFETCQQLHEQGLLQGSPQMAFMKLRKESILDNFKDKAVDFIDKVKDHMSQIAERYISRGHGR